MSRFVYNWFKVPLLNLRCWRNGQSLRFARLTRADEEWATAKAKLIIEMDRK